MSRKLIAYFSATGTTAAAAKTLADVTGADVYEIRPQTPYTAADLDWKNEQSRSSVEMKNRESRPPLADHDAKIADYDVIFLGYPIWWGVAPTVVNNFLESYDFAGKTIIPFATSGSSGIGTPADYLSASIPTADLRAGSALNDAPSAEKVTAWVNSLSLD